MSDAKTYHDLTYTTPLIVRPGAVSESETWNCLAIYRVRAECPYCHHHNEEFFRDRNQFRKPLVMKCGNNTCGRMFNLRGRNKS